MRPSTIGTTQQLILYRWYVDYLLFQLAVKVSLRRCNMGPTHLQALPFIVMLVLF